MPAKTPSRRSLTDPRHLMRFLKAQALSGTDAEKVASIAKSEGVSTTVVRQSIRMIEGYRAQNESAELQFAIRDLVISTIPKAKETLSGLLDAMELVEVKDEKTGKTKTIKQEDKTTRIEGMRIVGQLVASLQPKVAPVEVNVSQTNQVANLSNAETTEERMRRLREKAREFNALPPEVAAVPDAIDAGDDEGEGVYEEDGGEEEEDE